MIPLENLGYYKGYTIGSNLCGWHHIWIHKQISMWSICQSYAKRIEMSMMGELKYFIGLQIRQKNEWIYISQQKYIKDLLKKFSIQDCKPIATPMASSSNLDKDELGQMIDNKLYKGMIGSLLYLIASRPDIMFSVFLCARFQSNPKESHLKVVKIIFKVSKKIFKSRIILS